MTKSTNFFTFCKKNYANLLNSAPNRESILQCNVFFVFIPHGPFCLSRSF